ncbi:MAG: DNA repair protein RecN [Lachnospiraceae bacterium]|nr:DNA repair protein RecN [Lachnospiraceae bacterium]
MLCHLHVKNLAIIREAEADFSEHLNILTGETGAGKSVIIGAASLGLGGKAGREMIRDGAEYALVELLFTCESELTRQVLAAHDLPCGEEILISRKIYPGRTVNKVNDETVTVATLKEIAATLIDIHGQHEHQSLLHQEKHLAITDTYAKNQELLAQVRGAYAQWQKAAKERRESEMPEEERLREISFLDYECKEIEEAGLKETEEEELESRYRLLSNMSRIEEGIAETYGLTGERRECASDQIGRALRALRGLTEYDESLEDLCEELSQAEDILSDFNRQIWDYQNSLSFDHEEFSVIEKRLDEIRRIYAKYGGTYERTMAHYEEISDRLLAYQDYDRRRAELQALEQERKEAYLALAGRLSSRRRDAAAELEGKITEALLSLNFLTADFHIEVRESGQLRDNGTDDLEFLISTNPGEKARSLGAVASGGELSRIMLAIKSILATQDQIPTLIFDEIDTGISGVTAQRVAERMAEIAGIHQVICITHLQQIAAMADRHLFIEKDADAGETRVRIRTLEGDESVEELARMVGGANRSEAVVQAAREMKALAEEKKRRSADAGKRGR